MGQPAPGNGNPISFIRDQSNQDFHQSSAQPIVVVATTDTAIRDSMRELLGLYQVKTIWAQAVAEVKAIVSNENVAACFSGFWLVDGTYRDVVRHLKRQTVEIPAIILCAPGCPQEYTEYLAALKIRAFDFICHPYGKSDLERILRAAISNFRQAAQLHAILGNRANDEMNRESGLRKAG